MMKFIVILLLLGAVVTTAVFLSEQNGVDGAATYGIEHSETANIISMSYGANEDDNWMLFARDSRIPELHKDVSSEYIRVWLSSQSYRESTIPLQDGSYDFTNLDSFIQATLAAGAIPFITFAHAPGTFGEGHGNPPPEDMVAFSVYIRNVVEHYHEYCRFRDCDVNEWYFEIWNEPFLDEWWQDDIPRYATIFNLAQAEIYSVAPDAKVGGYSGVFLNRNREIQRLGSFLDHSSPDFVSIHHYGNILNIHPEKKMEDVSFITYQAMKDLRLFIDSRKPHSDIEIIESEYNSDFRASEMKHLDEQYTAAWYAAALIGHIKSGEVAIELFYGGTSKRADLGFCMWAPDTFGNIVHWPTYHMKKLFVQYNTKGSFILDSSSPDSMIETLYVENRDGRFLTVVNKNGKQTSSEVYLDGTSARNVVSGSRHSIVSNALSISLQPYEVLFFEVTP